jgi:hypothetical protein
MYQNMMTKFQFGGANKPGVYYDEENRRHLLSIRTAFAEAAGNMADENRKDEAKNLMEKAEQNILTTNLPYAMVSRYGSHNQSALVYLEAAYKAGLTELAEKVRSVVRKDLEQQKAYYDYLKTEREQIYASLLTDNEINNRLVVVLEAVEKEYGAPQVKTGVEGNNPVIQTPARAADSVNQ